MCPAAEKKHHEITSKAIIQYTGRKKSFKLGLINRIEDVIVIERKL